MKSGQVLTDRRYKWFEPEYWRFGDPASAEGQINYMRHASGQVCSTPVEGSGVSPRGAEPFCCYDVSQDMWMLLVKDGHFRAASKCDWLCNNATGLLGCCVGRLKRRC